MINRCCVGAPTGMFHIKLISWAEEHKAQVAMEENAYAC
jgi:hypothetical protein